jgi:hypothetical protein
MKSLFLLPVLLGLSLLAPAGSSAAPEPSGSRGKIKSKITIKSQSRIVSRVESTRQELTPETPSEKQVLVYDAETGRPLGLGRVSGANVDVGLVRAVAVLGGLSGGRVEPAELTARAVPVRAIRRGGTQARVYGVTVLDLRLDPTSAESVTTVPVVSR